MNSPLSTRESLLYIAKQEVSDIDLVITHGSPSGIACRIENGMPVIIWDEDFWDYIVQNIFLADTWPYNLQKDAKIINEYFYNFHGILYYHLSKRFRHDSALSAAFIHLANIYQYPSFVSIYSKSYEVSPWRNDYDVEIFACKLLALFHELAHILFSREINLKQELEEKVIKELSEYVLNRNGQLADILYKMNKKDIPKQWYSNIISSFLNKESTYLDLLEELAADMFAVCKTHATLFLNFKNAPGESLSNALLSGLLVYYSHIINFGRIYAFWDNIRLNLLLENTSKYDAADHSLDAFNEKTIIRGQVFPMVEFMIVCGLDSKLWGDNPDDFQKRRDIIFDTASYNNEWYISAYNSAMDLDCYRKALMLAIQIKQTQSEGEYSLKEVPDNALIINWTSLQYHNNLGLVQQGKGLLTEAIRSFSNSLFIAENYLGHLHRITARGYNNCVTPYLHLYKQTTYSTYLVLAKQFSDTAMDIISQTNDKNDIQASAIFQNAGVVEQWSGNPEAAIKLYMKAKRIKKQHYKQYNYSMAVTDSSIAGAYYHLGKKSLSKRYCVAVLDYFQKIELSPDDQNYKDMRSLLNMLS